MTMIHAYSRRANSGPWKFYGSFTQAEWQAELASHIAFLRSMGPFYVLTKRSGKRGQLELPRCRPDLAGQGQRAADKPLAGRVPQLPCDIGLFSDDAKQIDAIGLLNRGDVSPNRLDC